MSKSSKNILRVLGIDTGTALVGWSILDGENNNITHIASGCIVTDKSLDMSLRLKQIYDDLIEIITEYKPSVMAVEELFYFKNHKTVISVAQARGVIILAAENNGLLVEGYTPLQVKMAVTGYGRAEKKQIQFMVTNMLNLNTVPKPDDIADAMAIAICHLHTKNDW